MRLLPTILERYMRTAKENYTAQETQRNYNKSIRKYKTVKGVSTMTAPRKPTARKTTAGKPVANNGLKKTCGAKSASIAHNNTAKPSEIADIVKNSLYWYNREIVKTDQECLERLNEYFTRIVENEEIPTVEKMCLALGTTRKTVWEWEQGSLGFARSNMIKKAKEISAALDAELVKQRQDSTDHLHL